VTGVRASLALTPGRWVGFDLGGGSMEIAVVDAGAVTWTDSFPLGAARLWRTMVAGDPMTRGERRGLRSLVTDLLTPVVGVSGAGANVPYVIAGGTAGAVVRLLAAWRWPDPPDSLNQFEVTTEDLREVSRTLCTSDRDERLAMPGIDERRVDLLPAGSVVLATALEVFGARTALHSEWGLREGVVLRALAAPIGTDPAELRRSAVDHLADRWHADGRHATAVRRHAERLFDETRALHGLGDIDRELLGSAARLHDIGTRISVDKHHKHGAYIVEHAGLRGFSPDEVAMMACVVRFQRGSQPRTTYPPFAGLLPTERDACRAMVGIVRIAHALARGGEADVVAIDVEVSGSRVVVSVSGDHPTRAIADAQEQAALLGRALGSTVRIAAASGHPSRR
jgi:exopolyphosphatase / guanosine-5'-triphosphate,3'-diphosphate pyrophosphatase